MADNPVLRKTGNVNEESHHSAPAEGQSSEPLPPWIECDVFCIQGYSGAIHCGWRGRIRDIHRDPTGRRLICPRCGQATLLGIPLEAPPIRDLEAGRVAQAAGLDDNAGVGEP